MRLYREGTLFPHKRHIPAFGDYAAEWWDWETCEYLKNQKGRKDITRAYADNCRKMVRNQILPCFGKTRLDRITSEDINRWLLGFKERRVINAWGKEEIKSYKNTYANTVFGTFWLMLNEAVNRGLIRINPAAAVRKLKNDRKAIEIITAEEVRLLFPRHWETIWGDDRISYLGNKLAACTGMRASEILGLRGEYIYDEYIYVCAQYDEYGYRPTKTKEKRNIPLAPVILNELRRLATENNNSYVFSLDGGETPVTRRLMYNKFHRALKDIGMTREEIKRRGLSMHSWRNFLQRMVYFSLPDGRTYRQRSGHPEASGHGGNRAPFQSKPPLYYPFTANGQIIEPGKYATVRRQCPDSGVDLPLTKSSAPPAAFQVENLIYTPTIKV
jgi:integrase